MVEKYFSLGGETMTELDGDSFWLEASSFVKQHLQPGDQLLAPLKFRPALSPVSYSSTYRQQASEFDWVLIHKGMLSKVDRSFLRQTLQQLHPVFANEVFVIFAKRQLSAGHAAPLHNGHFQAFLSLADPEAQLDAPPKVQSEPSAPSLRRWVRRWLGTERESGQMRAILDCSERIDENSRQVLTLLDRMQALERALGQNGQTRPGSAWIGSKTLLAQMSRQEFYERCRAACQTAYLGEGEILCRVLGTYMLYGDTTDVGILPHLCLNGYWEPWLTLAVLQTLKPGDACLDVGANHGYYALVAAGAVGPTGRVLALEPNFKLAELVRKSLEVNGFNQYAQILPLAASERSGDTVNLVVPHGNTGHASLHINANAADQVMAVQTTTIDELTADWPHVDLIKIDTEGAEAAVWGGMKQTVRRNPEIKIVLEFGSARYPQAQAFLEEILAEGFILRYVDYDAQIKPLSLERCLTERPESYWDLFLSRR